MKISILLLILLLFIPSHLALAHPPSKMELSYDQQSQLLHVAITHISGNLRKHRIREVSVYLNEDEAWKKTFATQTTPATLTVDVPLKAEPDDKIRVKAICSEAGYGEAFLTVAKEEPPPAKQPK